LACSVILDGEELHVELESLETEDDVELMVGGDSLTQTIILLQFTVSIPYQIGSHNLLSFNYNSFPVLKDISVPRG
jgi:hypothetical protein